MRTQSPAIDRGAPAIRSPCEPIPNGGYINIGAYGNTAQASKSPAQYMMLLAPNGGESIHQPAVRHPLAQRRAAAGTVDLEYSSTGIGGPFQTFAGGESNDGYLRVDGGLSRVP